MPSSSATCSTSTVSTMRLELLAGSAPVLDRPAEEHQPGGRAAGAADQRRQRDRVGVPVVRHQRGVLDGVLDQAQLLLPALLHLVDDAEDEASKRSRRPGCAADRPVGRLDGGQQPGPRGRGRVGPLIRSSRREPNRRPGDRGVASHS